MWANTAESKEQHHNGSLPDREAGKGAFDGGRSLDLSQSRRRIDRFRPLMTVELLLAGIVPLPAPSVSALSVCAGGVLVIARPVSLIALRATANGAKAELLCGVILIRLLAAMPHGEPVPDDEHLLRRDRFTPVSHQNRPFRQCAPSWSDGARNDGTPDGGRYTRCGTDWS